MLKQIRKDIFDAAFDPDICGYSTTNELAEEADLCWTTVDNLYRGVTKKPGWFTIVKLAKAVGMDVRLIDRKEFSNV